MPRPSHFRGLLCLIAALVVGSSAARAELPLPLTPVAGPEAELLRDAQDGRLDGVSLLEAALIAGGISNSDELHALREQFDVRCRSMGARLAAAVPNRQESAALLFDLLHRELLTGSYQANVTVVDATLRRGDYNCVTATLLYTALCQYNGIEVQILATTGHVYCRLPGMPPRDVEPTCPQWFSRSRAAIAYAPQPLGVPVAGPVSAASGEARRPRPSAQVISDLQLVARIYYNRGVALLEKREFAAALSLLDRCLQLDPHNADARENLLAGVNNWALARCDAGDFRGAVELIAEGRLIGPNYAPLAANELHVHQRWVAQLCDRHEYAAALEVLEQGRLRRPDAPLFTSGFEVVREAQKRWEQNATPPGPSHGAAK